LVYFISVTVHIWWSTRKHVKARAYAEKHMGYTLDRLHLTDQWYLVIVSGSRL
jgi:hypothetical protein